MYLMPMVARLQRRSVGFELSRPQPLLHTPSFPSLYTATAMSPPTFGITTIHAHMRNLLCVDADISSQYASPFVRIHRLRRSQNRADVQLKRDSGQGVSKGASQRPRCKQCQQPTGALLNRIMRRTNKPDERTLSMTHHRLLPPLLYATA